MTAMDTQAPILAWHGNPDLKLATLGRMREHANAGRIQRGIYLRIRDTGWCGCLLGTLCAETLAAEAGVEVGQLRDGGAIPWHEHAERMFGLPVEMAYILDHVFEHDPDPAPELALRLLKAIPVGADLSGLHLRRLGREMEDLPPDHQVVQVRERLLATLAALPVEAS